MSSVSSVDSNNLNQQLQASTSTTGTTSSILNEDILVTCEPVFTGSN